MYDIRARIPRDESHFQLSAHVARESSIVIFEETGKYEGYCVEAVNLTHLWYVT